MADVARTVVVVDDDASVLRSLARLLGTVGYEVLTFDRPRAFLDRAYELAADCAILDLRMPELSGLDVQRELTDRGCAISLVFLTGHGDVPASVQAMKGGAVDFLLKPVDDEQLLAAVRAAIERGARSRVWRTERDAREARLAKLSPRERDVCALVVQGLLNKQIASTLGTSESTVKTQRARILEKVGVTSTVELVRLLERQRAG